MSLTVQSISLLISFILGVLDAFIDSLVNRLFYCVRKHLIRYIIECLSMFLYAGSYLLVLVKINDGQIRYSLLVSFILGIFCYERYLAVFCLHHFEKGMEILGYFFRPIRFIFNKICAIFKVVKEGLNHEKTKQKKKS